MLKSKQKTQTFYSDYRVVSRCNHIQFPSTQWFLERLSRFFNDHYNAIQFRGFLINSFFSHFFLVKKINAKHVAQVNTSVSFSANKNTLHKHQDLPKTTIKLDV